MVSSLGNVAATLPAANANGGATRPYPSEFPSADDPSASALRKAHETAKRREGHETDDPEGQRGTELLPYHHEAHEEATQYLRTLYLEIEKDPTAALYNYNKFNAPSPAAREAMDKIDKINGRLMTINCSSNRQIEVGQIMRDRFVRTWRLFIYAPEERKGRHRSTLADMCKELHYPSEWANVPPGDFEEPH
ncbi:uncharacterized protein N7473_007579 [Penicillium subrubescens]|nr:uncharacterized protein N7473_007579 [Penicillium subrubescens]KAJ5891351.1 hypothetical protein N7473_007579 [Penicillium subrubescens]